MDKKIGTRIELNDVEIRICKHTGKRRYNSNVESNANNARIGDLDDLEMNIEGFAGEMAFAKVFNLYPDFTIEPRTSEEDEGDFKLEGKKIDVKTTKYIQGSLAAPVWSGKKVAEIYGLLVGKMPHYIFKGFMSKEELLQQKRIGTLGHGDTFLAEQNELKELDEVIAGMA